MLHHILGIRPVNFTADDGRAISGTTIYVSFADEGVIGEAADKLFVSSTLALPVGLKPGDMVNITFNRKGKVDRITTDDIDI